MQKKPNPTTTMNASVQSLVSMLTTNPFTSRSVFSRNSRMGYTVAVEGRSGGVLSSQTYVAAVEATRIVCGFPPDFPRGRVGRITVTRITGTICASGKNRSIFRSLPAQAPLSSKAIGIYLGTCPAHGAVAQLVRVPDCRSGGCGFESRRPRLNARFEKRGRLQFIGRASLFLFLGQSLESLRVPSLSPAPPPPNTPLNHFLVS